MRILFVLPAYEPAWPLGAVVRCTSTLCRGLAAAGHAVTVYTTNASGTSRPLSFHPGQLVDQGGVSTFYFSPTFGCQSVFDSRALVRHLRQTVKTYDLVYISAVWQWIGVEAASTCVAAGVPMVTGLHGSLDE